MLKRMSRIYKTMPKVAVLLPIASKVNRDMRKGILKYVQQRGHWMLHFIENRLGEQPLSDFEYWGCTGIVGRAYTPELADMVARSNLPCVLSYPSVNDPPLRCRCSRHGSICPDSDAVGGMGAEHFLEKGFCQYGFVGDPGDMIWSFERSAAFERTVKQAGYKCHVYQGPFSRQKREAGIERSALEAWLRSVPKPIGLMAATDYRGRQVIEACASAGIRIPNDVAVLGVDNDEELCETTSPALSSVLMTAEDAGYKAAETLDGYMRGSLRKRRVIMFGPSRVVSRGSTERPATSDPLVLVALEFIRLNASVRFGVPDVVRRLKVSRRLVETRFREVLGRTVLDEILRTRLERVRRLLVETALPIGEITQACGFEHPSCLGRLFRKRFHCAMGEYRESVPTVSGRYHKERQ
jgi:LacI family transcriptional regulator